MQQLLPLMLQKKMKQSIFFTLAPSLTAVLGSFNLLHVEQLAQQV
jgi:hypothetical protein